MTEFKVDKLGFYRTENGRLAYIDELFETKYKQKYAAGRIKNIGYWVWTEQGIASTDIFNLIEFIAPFDVWEYAKELLKS